MNDETTVEDLIPQISGTPEPYFNVRTAMSRRDTMALGILNAMISKGMSSSKDTAYFAIKLADQLIAELDKSREGK